jgi:hypothetical protein
MRDLGNGLVYTDDAFILNMPPMSVETLEFTTWVPTSLESLGIIAWTYWQGDSVPEDDTLRSGFRVRVRDVAVTTILQPPSAADSGVYYNPSCRVRNQGTQPETFNVNFRIGLLSTDVLVTNLPPLYSRVVTAPDSWQAMPGVWLHRVAAELPGDMRPGNNVMWDTIDVQGTIRHDLAVEMLTPAGVYDTTDTVWPSARVANYGGSSECFYAHLRCLAPGDTCVYHEWLEVTLQGGAVTIIYFPEVRFTTLGDHVARCSLAIVLAEPVVDTSVFTIVPGTGLAGEQRSTPAAFELRASFGGRIRYSLPSAGRSALAIFSSDGRLVRRLRDGPDEAGVHELAWDGRDDAGRRVGRGVYCCRLVSDAGSLVTKLLLTG